ncbi:MAG: hypothetical protein HGA19_16710, partial [Oscillochloris sp.]|nr:hypothetical protein [Oscillochloris sp.]
MTRHQRDGRFEIGMDLHRLLPARCARIFALSARRPRCAVALARRLLGLTPFDHPDYPWVQLTLGTCLVYWEALPPPVELLHAVVQALEARCAPWGVLTARTALLTADLLQHGGPDLLPMWDDLARDWQSAGWPIEAARMRLGQIRTLNTLSRPAAALSLAEVLEPALRRAGASADLGSLACYSGTALFQLGAFPAAAAQLAAAEAIFQRLRHPAECAKVWVEQGSVAFLKDDFPQAVALYARAQRRFLQLGMLLRAASCDKNIGLCLVKLGQTDHAIARLLAARAVMLDVGQPYQVADCALNLGNAAYHSGLYDLALGTWRQTEAAYLQLNVQRMALVSRRNQAEALIRLGQLAAAEALLAALIGEATAIGAQRDLPEILQAMGEVLQSKGDVVAALG